MLGEVSDFGAWALEGFLYCASSEILFCPVIYYGLFPRMEYACGVRPGHDHHFRSICWNILNV